MQHIYNYQGIIVLLKWGWFLIVNHIELSRYYRAGKMGLVSYCERKVLAAITALV